MELHLHAHMHASVPLALQDAQGQDSVARSHSALRLDPDEQDMFDASPSLQSHADSVSHPAGDTR